MTVESITQKHGAAESLDSLAKAEQLLGAALAKKAFNPVVMDLKGLSALTDYFLIVSGRSAKHVTAVAESVIEQARSMNILRLSAEGVREGNWALLDYGDVIVHVFRQSTREFYDLEGLWREAPRVAFSGERGKQILAAQQRVMEEDAYEYDDEDDE